MTQQVQRLAAVMALVSVLLILVAVVLPQRAGTALAATGLASLMALRVFAMRSGWPPRAARAPARIEPR